MIYGNCTLKMEFSIEVILVIIFFVSRFTFSLVGGVFFTESVCMFSVVNRIVAKTRFICSFT